MPLEVLLEEVVALEPNSLQEIYNDVLRLARACGVEERGEQLVSSIKAEMAQIAAVARATGRTPRVINVEWQEPLMAAGNWIPELMRKLVGQPVAELSPEPFSEFVHGTFFYGKNKEFVLAQVLNALELVTEGEYRPSGRVKIVVDPHRLKVTGAQVVWPKKQPLDVTETDGRTQIIVENPSRYTAILLKI